MLYFICFILGMLTLKTFQSIVDIDSTYRIFKFAEIYSMALVLETEVWRKQAITIIKIVYDDADRQEQCEKIVAALDKRFDEVQQNIIKLIKKRVPYEVKYNSLSESETYIKYQLKLLEGEADGQSNRRDN